MLQSDVEMRWIKFGTIKDFVIINDREIAMASGIHVMFLNLATKEKRFEKFDSPERGKGVSCLATHPMIPMFATAERRSSPKIFIFTYPGIRRVSCCSLKRGPNGYLSCAFAGTDYFLSLTNYPDFQIIVWSWRTGEILTSISTRLTDLSQRITCSPSPPHQVSQFGEQSGNLVVYEISVCSRIVMISPTYSRSTVATNRIVCTTWSNDGDLFECDINGNVLLNSNDGKRHHLIVHGKENDGSESKGIPLIETFRSGILLVDEESRIVFYRKPASPGTRVKSGTLWRSVWSLQLTSHPFFAIRFSHRDSVLFNCYSGEIFEFTGSDDNALPIIRNVINQISECKFLMSINPRGDHIVTIDEFDRLNIHQFLTGYSVSNLSLKTHGIVMCAVSHPNLPLIAIGTAIGKFVLINLCKISQPSITKVIHLVRDPLKMLHYSWSANCLGIGDVKRDKLFIISSSQSDPYCVQSSLHFKVEIIDFLIYKNCMESAKVLILARTNRYRSIGKNIIVYHLANMLHKECLCIIELPYLLDCLYPGRSEHEIIVMPYLKKQIHFMKVQDDFQGLTLIEALSSGHQLRSIKFHTNDSFVLTSSYDGLIIIRNKANVHQVIAIFVAHHQLDGGAKTAIMSPFNHTIVSLGRNGDLVATKICNVQSVANVSITDPEDLSFWAQQAENRNVDDLTWLEQKDAGNLQKEYQQCAEKRLFILEDFFKLREKLKILLDANERESKEAQLPISDFDLDRDSRAHKISAKVVHETRFVEELEREIFQRNKISEYLRKMCWDSMEIQTYSLLSIDGKTKIENFAIPQISQSEENRRKWESFIVDYHYSNKYGNDEMFKMPEMFSIIGTTTDRFLPDTSDQIINQLRKCTNYTEGVIASLTIKERERKLKIHFNKMFEKMQLEKDRVLTMAAECLEEIERCALELKNTFAINATRDNSLLQPLWHCTEKPETIVTITNTETLEGKAASYLKRDNRFELIRKQEENNLKLNDSFREEALRVMMDGLLEVRWEDEIKKDPPKPAFLSSKDPSSYTEEEMAEFEIYRMKCMELDHERDKYKKMLENKIIEIEESLRHGFRSFDRKLEAFRLDRMRIESAILQETLMHLREPQRHLLRQRGIETMRLAQQELGSAIEDLRNTNTILTSLENVLTESRNRYENLIKRDKSLDGKFRGEFPELKQPMVEHLLRQYRKRPKHVQFTCTSITWLMEIAQCIVNCEKSEILPGDCLEFLRGMDSLDAMPNNLPLQIDNNHWNLLCRLRRAKIELEIKIKICVVDLAEAEQTYVSYQKSCSLAESKVSQLREAIREREKINHEILENAEVQLILKMGQIEGKLYGDASELRNAILLPFFVVERANEAIIGASREKLDTMRRTLLFRSTIVWREWCHKCTRITLDNMRDTFKSLQGFRVTKEVQNYLRNDPPGNPVGMKKKLNDPGSSAIKKRFDKILLKNRTQFDDTVQKIAQWKEKNRRILKSTEKLKLARFQTSMTVHEENRKRDCKNRRTRIKAIMQRTRLKKKVQENYRELLALRTQLELLRLKTYPTLKPKGSPKDKQKIVRSN